MDDSLRHAITKLSHWHFVATEESRQRVIRMGERPEHVWVTGAPSLDGLADMAATPREQVLSELGDKQPDGSFRIADVTKTRYGSLLDASTWAVIESAAKTHWLLTLGSDLDAPAQKAAKALVRQYDKSADVLRPTEDPVLKNNLD